MPVEDVSWIRSGNCDGAQAGVVADGSVCPCTASPMKCIILKTVGRYGIGSYIYLSMLLELIELRLFFLLQLVLLVTKNKRVMRDP